MKNLKKLTLVLLITVLAVAFTTPPVSLSVDTQDSKVKWTGYHLAKSYEHYGFINIKSGNLLVEDGKLVGGKIIMDMNSIMDSDIPSDSEKNAKLVNHLKSEDFFRISSELNDTFTLFLMRTPVFIETHYTFFSNYC